MKKLGDIAQAIQGRIKTPSKAPKLESGTTFQAARRTAPPLIVLPSRIYDCLDILRDANSMAVLLAIANHANKAGMTHCSQDRIAALTRLSRKTVGRKLKLLIAAGLVKIEYRRPYAGSSKRLNVMRVIYDDGTQSRHDVAAIVGTASPTGHSKDVPQVNGHSAELSTGNLTEPYKAIAPTGQLESPAGSYPQGKGQVSDPPTGQIGHFAYGTLIESPAEQAKALNNRDKVATDYSDEEVFKVWRQVVRGPGIEVMPNESDKATCETLRQVGASLADIHSTLCLYFLTCAENGKPPAPRLRPGIADLLAC